MQNSYYNPEPSQDPRTASIHSQPSLLQTQSTSPSVPSNVSELTYSVGWICALFIELTAARAMFDEDYGSFEHQDAADTNLYARGRIHSHNVIIACLPSGVDGISAATVVAINMRRSFPNISVNLLVGIGGGIPHLQKGVDIRLGDVVVSKPEGDYGGVIQYPKGKVEDHGFESGPLFVHKGALNKPPPFLLKRLNMIQSDHERCESKISLYLEEMLRKDPYMKSKGYGMPISEDCLYENFAECDFHGKPLAIHKVQRAKRESSAPVIHYGNIASGDYVIKDANFRDYLRNTYAARCVEMEAAGLMDDFPCIIIRGICDYADRFKSDDWHRYAASTAAAFAKEFLLYIGPKQSQQLHVNLNSSSYLLSPPAPQPEFFPASNSFQEDSMTVTELLAQGNSRLDRSELTKTDLLHAHQSFSSALSKLTTSTDATTDKTLCRVYHKLMMTSLQMTFLRTDANERVQRVDMAIEYGRKAFHHAERSGNTDRLMQMKFYFACVRARKVVLCSSSTSERRTMLDELDAVMIKVRQSRTLNPIPYQAMYDNYRTSLLKVSGTQFP